MYSFKTFSIIKSSFQACLNKIKSLKNEILLYQKVIASTSQIKIKNIIFNI